MNWLATTTGSDTSYKLPGISVYLAPFFAYRYAQEAVLGGPSNEGRIRFLPVHVLATLFYVCCALIVLWRALSALGVPHLRKALALALLTTAVPWYFLVLGTNTSVFGLAYSALVFSYFTIVWREGATPGRMAILGLSLGLGLLIRPQHYWIGLLPLALLLGRARMKLTALPAFAAGALFPILLLVANRKVQLGGLSHVFMPFSPGHGASPALVLSSLEYQLVGPNGYFRLLPVYLLALFALPWAASRKQLGPTVWVLALAFAFPVLSLARAGVVLDEIAGRHFLEYSFLVVLIISGALQALENRSLRWYRAGLGVCACLVAWNLAVTASAYFVLSKGVWTSWQQGGQVGVYQAWSGLLAALEKVSAQRLAALLGDLLGLLPLILLLSLPVRFLVRSPASKLGPVIASFIVYGVVTFSVFTALNLARHGRNVDEHRLAGLYQSKVIGKAGAIFRYDDIVETNRMTIRYFLSRGDCRLAEEMVRHLRAYLAQARAAVESDPIGFLRDLDRGILRRSAFEEEESARQVDRDLKEKCGLSIL
ncbi:MAG TPA: hypothetical protein VM598_12555 [Bdellovibrionota bacterium]|nr:hypothetical protein [Bdellovibrionota bacterium]